MKKAFLLTFFLFTLPLFAEDENYISYDSIVNELTLKQPSAIPQEYFEAPLYIGFGYVNSTSKINGSNIPLDKMSLQGLQFSMGMDMLPRFTTAIQLTYLTNNTKNSTEMDALEFDLMGIFKPQINSILSGRLGAGIGVRNVDIKAPKTQTQFTNPLAIFVGGVEARVSKQVGIVTDVSYKNALTTNNAEKYVVDFGVRIDGHF